MDYPAEVRLEVYDAIVRYAQSGTLSELKPQAKMAFSFIRKEIDRNKSKYNESVSNGKKGGNPNFVKGMSNPYYNGKINKDKPGLGKITQDNPHITQDNLIDSDNVSDNDNVSSPHTPRGAGGGGMEALIHDVFAGFFSKRQHLEAFCINSRTTPEELRGLAGEIYHEWMLTNETDISERHLVNHLRTKLKHKRNENKINAGNTRGQPGGLYSRLPDEPEYGLIE